MNRKEYDKAYYEKNREKKLKRERERYCKNREEVLEERKEYRLKNIEEFKMKDAKYYENNREEILKQKKNYRKQNIDKINEARLDYKNNGYFKNYYRNRYKNDELYKLGKVVRVLINSSIIKKGFSKNSKTTEILGCTFEEFKIYLESKFESWMNWGNYGNWNGQSIELNESWDIDHIIPISTACSEEEIIKLNHYTNLQPLCSYTNRHIKVAKIILK